MKTNRKSSLQREEEEEAQSHLGLIFAGLGTLCLAHSIAWIVMRDEHATPDSFVGAEGMAAWSIVFMLIGLTLWIVERRS